jgi:hypothetical protein
VIIDSAGKDVGSFQKKLSIDLAAKGRFAAIPSTDASDTYTYKLALKPGTYRVNIAVHDSISGAVGSGRQTIDLPDLSTKKLALSSVLLGSSGEGSSSSQLNVAHVFERKMELLYTAFVYNAADIADLQGQVSMLQNGQVVAAGPVRKIVADKDRIRIPFEDGVTLNALQPGSYTLQIRVFDPATKAEAVQQTPIVIR